MYDIIETELNRMILGDRPMKKKYLMVLFVILAIGVLSACGYV